MHPDGTNVCSLTGVVDVNGSALYRQDPVSLLSANSQLDATNEALEREMSQLRTTMMKRAKCVLMNLVTGRKRYLVTTNARERQARMKQAIKRKRSALRTKRDRDEFEVMVTNHEDDIKETNMRTPIRDKVEALDFVDRIAREAQRVFVHMDNAPKDWPVMCSAYAFVLRRGVCMRDGTCIIPPHTRMPMPGIHRMAGVDFPAKRRRLYTATGEITKHLMNSASARALLARTYGEAAPHRTSHGEKDQAWIPAAKCYMS